MAKKKLFDEDGNEVKGKLKKPFYKKWWFWLIVVIIVFAGLGGSGQEESAEPQTSESQPESTESTESTETKESAAEEAAESIALPIGEAFTVDGITVTVTNSYFTDERNEFDDTNPAQVIAIEYTLENNSEEDYPFGMDFQVYSDGSLADTYPNENSMGSVSPGRSTDAVAHYGVDGSVIEAEWEPIFSFSGEKGIWNVTPE